MTQCVKCNNEIHPLRLKVLPNTKVCVNCSTVGAYKAVSTVNGEGDHTWNDIQIMTPEQAKAVEMASSNKPKLDSYKDLDA